MIDENKRTTVSVTAAVLLSGCTTLSRERTQETDSKPTESPDRPSNCALHHELASDESLGYESENLEYETLSANARYLFEQTVKNDGYVTKNESRDSPEFDYDDTASRYKIRRNNTTYALITYSGSGC